MPSILAIAIGDPANSRLINNATGLHGVRPYITGLYNYLSQKTTLKLGIDYTIDYRECWEDDEKFIPADIIFCMSTPVVRKAKTFSATIPIVGVFSEHAAEQFDQTRNICGINAKRIQNGRKYYDKFADLPLNPSLNKLYILHRVGNTASNKCLDAIKSGVLRIAFEVLNVTTAPGHDIGALINTVPIGPQSGLLVLPVDLFFGASAFITRQAKSRSLSVFWPATDWTGVSAYGAAQETCGQLMGRQVQYILANPGNIPQPPDRFVDVPDADIKWVASKAAAEALNIKLGRHEDLRII